MQLFKAVLDLSMWGLTVFAFALLWVHLARGEIPPQGYISAVKRSERPVAYWVNVTGEALVASVFLFTALVRTLP